MTAQPDPEWPYPVSSFTCQMCGNCCRGDGYVELSERDIRRLAEHFGLSREAFLKQYCHYDRSSRFWCLNDQEDELQSCIFLENNRCRVNDVKPQQCRDFPSRWRPDNILDFCEGWRLAAGLPPAKKKTMTED